MLSSSFAKHISMIFRISENRNKRASKIVTIIQQFLSFDDFSVRAELICINVIRYGHV